ncbi:putative ribonuclease H-like domain-containing protein, partial [Tanacetum coccineum]
TVEKVETRKSSTNSKKEEILTEPQQENEASSTGTSEDNPKILAFRRELEAIAQKHLGTVPENNSISTLSVNSGSEPVKIGIFDEASYDEEGVVTDFNNLPTEIEMSSMGELTFFLGLQVKQNKAGIFISQDKYVAEILKKFDLVNVKAAITPMETKVALTKDEEAIDVDVHLYRSMIGHSKDFTSQCCEENLQTIVATSTTEAEYVAATNCYGQHNLHYEEPSISFQDKTHRDTSPFLEIVIEKELISMLEKIHTDLNVADLLTKPFDGPRFNYLVVSIGFAEIVDFLRGSNLRYALTSNPTIYDSLVKQFWQTATANTIADGTLEIHATIDTTGYTITEASIRDKLQLADATGITMLPNDEIFEGDGGKIGVKEKGKAHTIIEEAPKKSKEQILQEEASLAKASGLDTLQKERRLNNMLGSDLQGEDFAKKMVDLVNQRKKYFAEERARAKRNKPMTQSQLKTYMMNYLKNQGTWKLSQLKNLSFEEVKEEFDKLVKQVESFAPINFEATKASLKRFGEELQTKTSKRLKSDEAKDDEPTKKSGKRRKQMARKGLHTDIDKDDSEDSDEVS